MHKPLDSVINGVRKVEFSLFEDRDDGQHNGGFLVEIHELFVTQGDFFEGQLQRRHNIHCSPMRITRRWVYGIRFISHAFS